MQTVFDATTECFMTMNVLDQQDIIKHFGLMQQT